MRGSILPYTRPDWNDTPADKNVQTDLNILQEGQILVRKCLTRCLCSPNIINIKLRQEKQVKINSNNITLSSAKKRTMSKEIQNRIQNKSGYNSKFNLKPSLSIYVESLTSPRQVRNLLSFVTLSISITEKNSAWQENKYSIPPTGWLTYAKSDPYSEFASLGSGIRR